VRAWSSLVLCLLMVRPSLAQEAPATRQDQIGWLGCYILSWRGPRGGTVTDSIRVVLRSPTTPSVLNGYRLAWPDRGDSNPQSVGGRVFMGPVWVAARDSLVITEGMLTTSRAVIRRDRKGLFGLFEMKYDAGPPWGYSAHVAVNSVPCPVGPPLPMQRIQ
jgi:hypothetical protein